MQNLATGVGDLKRVLTNVKTRGTWAEVQLGALLEQTLTSNQFARNVQVKEDSRELVEFAVRMPGPKDDPDACVWLPIDSKFPQEDYVRLQDAAERGDVDAVQKASDALGALYQSASRGHQLEVPVPAQRPPSSRSCSCRPKAFTPRCCVTRRSRTSCSTSTTSCQSVQRTSPHSSAPCGWASRHSPSSSSPPRSGRYLPP